MVDALAERLAGTTGMPYPDCLPRLDFARAQELALEFHAESGGIAPGALRPVDKNPLNFLHLGLISLVFPEARILHCVRDPLDTCLSVYFQHFAHVRNNYAYDLDDIAFFYTQYAELMAHWRDVLPTRSMMCAMRSWWRSQKPPAVPWWRPRGSTGIRTASSPMSKRRASPPPASGRHVSPSTRTRSGAGATMRNIWMTCRKRWQRMGPTAYHRRLSNRHRL